MIERPPINARNAFRLLPNRAIQSESEADRSTVEVTAVSIVTLPTVRIRSGSISTATSKASGPTGTPIASAIGPIEVTKLTAPGRLTEPTVVTSATAAPAAIVAGVSGTPVSVAR